MRFLPFICKSALRNRRRFVLTVFSVAVSLFMFSTLMTVLTELERENPSEVAHLRLVVGDEHGNLAELRRAIVIDPDAPALVCP